MSLRLVSLVALGVCSAATDVLADFEKACQAGSSECVDNSDDMYLIQKHVEVGSTGMKAKGQENQIEARAKHAIALNAKRAEGSDDPVVTTKGGGDDEGEPSCPLGFSAKPGYTPEDKVFGEAPESVATDMDSCASDCSNHSSCGSFQFGDSKCLLMSDTDPWTEFPAKDDKMKSMTFCSKDDNCTFVWPWTYYNKTDSVESNAWNAWNTLHRCWVPLFVWLLITWVIWVALAVLAWKLCFSPIPEILADPEDPVYTFESGHFDCMRRPFICCCSFFCPALQWALTMDLAGFLRVHTALGAFVILGFLQAFFSYTSIFFPGLLTVFLMMAYRQRLRRKLKCKPDIATSYFNDFWYLLCCPWCAIAQEAMVVQYAYSRGQTVEKVERIVQRVPETMPSRGVAVGSRPVVTDGAVYTSGRL
jgi:Cys-rich protein (TIGR01571 family)